MTKIKIWKVNQPLYLSLSYFFKLKFGEFGKGRRNDLFDHRHISNGQFCISAQPNPRKALVHFKLEILNLFFDIL
jgi:hypothetical protein